MTRIEQKYRAGFVGDTSEIFEVWIWSPSVRKRVIRITSKNKSDCVSVARKRTQHTFTPRGEFAIGNRGIRNLLHRDAPTGFCSLSKR